MGNQNYQEFNVLVVDDDELMNNIVSVSLAEVGITNVITAINGRSALAALDNPESACNLVLCDINMPEMDGVEFLRHLATRDFKGDVIIFSGEGNKLLHAAENLAKEHHLSILGVLEKPLDIDELKKLLSKHQSDSVQQQSSASSQKIIITPDDISRGIKQKEFLLYYQPQVSVIDKGTVGFESLARWQHPQYGILSPYFFIELAEEHGLIEALTFQLIDVAVANVKQWNLQSRDITVSLNLSAKLLNRLDLPEYLEKKLLAESLHPQNFIIEITESQLVKNPAAALEIISRLSLKRFKFSIDDFGTGYSSMKQLEQIPFSELKIDQAFVHEVAGKPSAKAILESSVALAKKLEIISVAEGVETQEDWDIAVEAGVDVIQGYLVAKPLPPEKIKDWLTSA